MNCEKEKCAFNYPIFCSRPENAFRIATPGYETVIHVNKSIKWNAEIINTDPALYAQGFKLYYYGTETFDIAGRWGGTLIAPNAEIILGQNWNKVIYGQFLAKQIVVHQYATIQRVIFNPITLDVAFMER